MTPWILNHVASVAEAVDDIALGTANGPMRLGLSFLRVMSAASTMVRVEGPPEPMMMPVRSLVMSSCLQAGVGDRLLHGDMVPGAALDRKRMARRSILSVGSSFGAPHTWQRKPCAAKSSEKLMPDLAS